MTAPTTTPVTSSTTSTTDEPAPASVDVVTFGESMVSFRGQGPLAQASRHTVRLAGAESNVAIGLARLGHTVAWAGRVGDDSFGRLVLRELRAEGVDTRYAVVDEERPTGLMFVEERTADLVSVEYRRAGSAGSAVGAADVAAALEANPRVLHVTGITPALSPAAADAVASAVRSASGAGLFVSLDVNFRSRLWSREQAREVLTPLADHATVLITSDDELDLVAAGDEEAAVADLLSRGVQQVAVKRGPLGATLHSREGRVDAPALAVTAIDPIGAGDAFTAGYLSGVLDGLDPAQCLVRGAATGAFAASTRGDWEGAPNRQELAALERHTPGATVR